MNLDPSHEVEGKIMRRILSLFAAGVLATGMAAAQTGSAPSTPPAQDTNQSATQPDRTSKAGAGQNADATRATGDNAQGKADNTPAPGTNGTSANQDAATAGRSGADQNGDATRAQSADASSQGANNPQPAPAQTRGGIPWLWIALGVVALIVIFALFGGNRDRVERTDRVASIDRSRTYDRTGVREDEVRRDDDIRRVG